jgi:hypothetical protein
METNCIYLKNKPQKNGYVRIRYDGKRYYAHRLAYIQKIGPIKQGMEIDHLCKNKACVNVKHLEQVTPTINKRRSSCPSGINYKKTHCIRGHEFNIKNTQLHKGERHCKICKRM